MFRPLPPDADFVALEEAELTRWAEHHVFERSVADRAGAPQWVFFEGPPTANGRPGLHHVWARAYKDLFCRYRTMRGYRVDRRAGWDTHGLPVEVEVEKQLLHFRIVPRAYIFLVLRFRVWVGVHFFCMGERTWEC